MITTLQQLLKITSGSESITTTIISSDVPQFFEFPRNIEEVRIIPKQGIEISSSGLLITSGTYLVQT
ncbi:MAG: hypothetical protein AABZ60_21770, partial [Planctomycetota bacterium]